MKKTSLEFIMPICPTLPSLKDLMAFRRESAISSEAVQLRNYINRTVKNLKPEALFAIALQRYPDKTPEQALELLGMWVTAKLLELGRLGEDARSALDAERARLEPLTRAATKRMFAAVERLGNIPRIVAAHEGAALEKRRELKLLGIEDQAIIERVAPMPDREQFEAEKDALRAEITALERFIRTGDESDLPPGIEPEPMREDEKRHVEQKSRLALLAEEVAALLTLPVRH